MTSSVRSANLPGSGSSAIGLELQGRRKQRLMGILGQGLPTLPSYVPAHCDTSGMNCVYDKSMADHRSDGGGMGRCKPARS